MYFHSTSLFSAAPAACDVGIPHKVLNQAPCKMAPAYLLLLLGFRTTCLLGSIDQDFCPYNPSLPYTRQYPQAVTPSQPGKHPPSRWFFHKTRSEEHTSELQSQ